MSKAFFVNPYIRHQVPAGVRACGTAAFKIKTLHTITGAAYVMGFEKRNGQKRYFSKLCYQFRFSFYRIAIRPVNRVVCVLKPKNF